MESHNVMVQESFSWDSCRSLLNRIVVYHTHVYVCSLLHICTHICTHTYAYYTHAHTYTYYTHAHTHTHTTHTHTHTRTHTTHTHTYYTHALSYSYTHAHTYVHTYTYCTHTLCMHKIKVLHIPLVTLLS